MQGTSTTRLRSAVDFLLEMLRTQVVGIHLAGNLQIVCVIREIHRTGHWGVGVRSYVHALEICHLLVHLAEVEDLEIKGFKKGNGLSSVTKANLNICHN